MFHEYNRNVSLFKTALEQDVPQDQNSHLCAEKTPAEEHPWRFNTPSAPEVTILLVICLLSLSAGVAVGPEPYIERAAPTYRT